MTIERTDTEQKIKEAARLLFHEKGFEATKTRDIAEAAGINLALLNYYFRSKKKLFDIIMTETMIHFFGGVMKILNDEKSSMEEKIHSFVEHYIDLLTSNLNIPHFVLNSVRTDPEAYVQKIGLLPKIKESHFFEQYMDLTLKGKIKPINPMHFLMNLMGLIVMPFMARPMITASGFISDAEWNEIIAERKKLIPEWIEQMIRV